MNAEDFYAVYVGFSAHYPAILTINISTQVERSFVRKERTVVHAKMFL